MDNSNTTRMISSVEQVADRTHAELNRLFNLYRLANLNARYYGCRAEKYEKQARYVLIVTGLLSALALSLLLADYGKTIATISAGLAAVLSGTAPFMGWTEKTRELRNQHFAYSQLFGQLEFVITEIRRGEELTDEQVGLSRMVHEAFMRIEALDELEPDQVLLDCEDAKVRKAFPDEYVWTNF